MSTAKAQAVGSGIGLAGLMFLVLLVLKLTAMAPEITWFWVFFPLWIGLAVVLGVVAVVLLGFGFIWLMCHAIEWASTPRRKKLR